jgi:hypothetical protein
LSFLQLARGPCESPGVCVQATDRSALRGVSASEVRSSGHRRLGRVAGADPLLGFHPSRAVSSPVVTRPMSRLLSCTSVLGCHQPATCAPEFQRTGKLAGLSRDCRPSWVFRPRPSGARRHHRVSDLSSRCCTVPGYGYSDRLFFPEFSFSAAFQKMLPWSFFPDVLPPGFQTVRCPSPELLPGEELADGAPF